MDCQIVDLSQLSSPDQSNLYRLNQSIRHRIHIVATLLLGSILLGQVQDMMRYQVSAQVATERFRQDGSLAPRGSSGVVTRPLPRNGTALGPFKGFSPSRDPCSTGVASMQ